MKTICSTLLATAALLFGPGIFESAAQTANSSDFAIYSSQGKVLSWDDVRTTLSRYDIVLVGEIHNDSIGHIIEFDLLQEMYADEDRSTVAVSMEMFDRDVQYIVDEYLNGYISEAHFKRSSRPWDNYDTDYRPMVEFAKENNLAVVAANTPRRYVNGVSRSGLSTLNELPATAKAHLPPLPVSGATEDYKDKWNTLMAEAMQHMMPDTSAAEHGAPETENGDDDSGDETETMSSPSSHGGMNMDWMLDAQNVWDAGMAHSIARHATDNPGASLIHYVGSFHVESGTGIPDHLVRYRPSARIVIVNISPVEDPAVFDEELLGTGDIIFQTREKK